uniref:C2H2-type domain-containing protein n=1 Tax=Stegastes partitus TaxID=144197 RepID=A0A3B5AQX3_9TELE
MLIKHAWSHLRDHRSTHTGGKLYGCNVCGKRFRSLDTLSGHMVLHSGHTAVRERRCVCEVCGKRFSTDKNLRIHMKNHIGGGATPAVATCLPPGVCSGQR